MTIVFQNYILFVLSDFSSLFNLYLIKIYNKNIEMQNE